MLTRTVYLRDQKKARSSVDMRDFALVGLLAIFFVFALTMTFIHAPSAEDANVASLFGP